MAKDSTGNKQGSEKKNLKRAKKMTGNKAKKIDQPSNRQGGPYRKEEIELWREIKRQKGEKRHISVHTNTETGVVRAFEWDGKGKIAKKLDEFKMENFEEIKAKLQELLK